MSFKKFMGSTLGTAFVFNKMPGTSTTLIAWIALYFLDKFIFTEVYWILFVLSILLGPYSLSGFQEEDPKFFTLDEFMAIAFIFALIPSGWIFSVLGFVLFRLLDIFKPLGISTIESYTKDYRMLSVYIDDFIAGCYTLLSLYGIQYLSENL